MTITTLVLGLLLSFLSPENAASKQSETGAPAQTTNEFVIMDDMIE